MGVIRLPFWRFFVANLAGKIVLSTLVAYLGRSYLASLDTLRGDSLIALAFAAAIIIAMTILLMRADWALALRVARAEGFQGLLFSA